MAFKLVPSLLATTAFAAMLFYFFLKRRLRGNNGGEANNNAAASDGTAGGASGAQTSKESHGMGTSSGYDYEVFLSFRGPDTRSGFTDFLYTSLTDAGIRVYKDDEDLREGDEFGAELLKAIDQSKISIPIFSKDYASSPWCLKEVAQMVKNKKAGKQKIMPIFYDVAPADVRYQRGGYEDAFRTHKKKKRFNEETICEWKAALKEVGDLQGWDLHSKTDRKEGEIAKTVTQKVFHELKKPYLTVSDDLVNVDHQVAAIMEMIGAQTSETRIIGIHGMGGIGKTTIAKIIYNQLSHNFENHCFLRNIRETSKVDGIQGLQNQLISDISKTKFEDIKDDIGGIQTIKDRLFNKRVLLLLDDVEEVNHIKAFVGEREGERAWLGGGSKIIITTRNKNILRVPEVDRRYEVDLMDPNQSLQLFSKHAFRTNYPLNEYIEQSKRAAKIAGGLPLALEIIGSHLSCTEKEAWDAALKKLESVPGDEVQSKLKISYDALNNRQKSIFLDIAGLFIGYEKDIMIHYWDELDFFPEEAMGILQNKSLIKITEDNKVWMHDLLRDLGRDIDSQKSEMKLEKQRRVWDPKRGLELLRRRRKGDIEVEALRVELHHPEQYRIIYEGFKSLPNLRFLEVRRSKETFRTNEALPWDERPSDLLSTNGNSYLLPQLRWLSWPNIPPTINLTNFSMEEVVILNLSNSKITHDWEGWSHMKVMKKLKVLDLFDCRYLKRTPDLSAQTKLECLILRWCVGLEEIDRSICHLKCLVSLDVSRCWSLQRLPDELGGDLASLKCLSLTECTSLERLPDTIGNLKSLIELDMSRSNIKELPDSIGELKNLKVVEMGNVLLKIPNAFWMIEKLEKIRVTGTTSMKFHVKIDDRIYSNKSLRILKLHWVVIKELPRLPESLVELYLDALDMGTFPDLSNLTNLKELCLDFAKPPDDDDAKSVGLVEVPISRWIGNLSKLESLSLRNFYVTTSTEELSLPPQLKSLYLGFSNLRNLLGDLSNLKKLSYLRIAEVAIAEIQGLGRLENLQHLELRYLGQVKELPDLSYLNKLRHLDVRLCGELIEIQGGLPESLEELLIWDCRSLQKLPDPSRLNGLLKVDIQGCEKLNVETRRLYLEKSVAFEGYIDESEFEGEDDE